MKWSKNLCIQYLTEMRDPLEESNQMSEDFTPEELQVIASMLGEVPAEGIEQNGLQQSI